METAPETPIELPAPTSRSPSTSTSPTTSATSATGSTASPRTSCGPPPRSGTSARRRPGRSSREAAKIGLYGFEALAQFYADPSGLTLPIVNEELFWGDAGIGMAIMGSSLAAAGIFSSGTPEQMGEWIPQCFGTADDPKVGSFCVSEPDAGSDVSSLRTRAVYDEAKDEWVLNGQKAWATNGGIANVHVIVASVDRELGSRGQAAFVIPPGTKGLEMGTKVKKHGWRPVSSRPPVPDAAALSPRRPATEQSSPWRNAVDES